MSSLTPSESLSKALSSYKRGADATAVMAAEEERAGMLDRFPRSRWSTLTLEEYALGQEDSSHTLCRWLEFQTPHMGSIRGGSSRKLIIYKHREKAGWYFPPGYATKEDAWDRVRAAFIRAFKHADAGEFEAIDDIEELQPGPALLLKLLYLYFPTEVLPICSQTHLRHFLAAVGQQEADDQNLGAIQLNRVLLKALSGIDEVADWSTKEIERLLYGNFDPRPPSVHKIAPGHDAEWWEDCLTGGYICVGWDQVGDLHEFESKGSFLNAFHREMAQAYPSKSKRTEKANELWTLTELDPDDLVVANQGTSRVLGVGTVVEPGYVWDDSRETYRHTVKVLWDTNFAREISPQKRWALVTVAKVPQKLQEEILGGRTPAPEKGVSPPKAPPQEIFAEIAASIERKGQAVLYGPPGTGKTWAANGFAEWWLRERNGRDEASAGKRDAAAGSPMRRVWWIVANPSEWSWNQLFEKGSEEFGYGRLQRNYPLVQAGDLVVGYQATPDKRLVALARIARGLGASDGSEPTITLEPVSRIDNGLTWEELSSPEEPLSASEPIRNRCQGTLFALEPTEAERLLTMLVERDPLLAEHADESGATRTFHRLTFHPSYSYEDFIEGFRPVKGTGGSIRLELADGVFKQICREAALPANRDTTFLVMIDEINRANIAKVFGELITLLERDKRGWSFTLPQSKEPFTIPPNVFLIGTMNTADRSIKLLDAALRRRFAFVELMPDLSLFEGVTVGGLELDEFLGKLNRTIIARAGREKQIGHSFFLRNEEAITDPGEFALIFRQEIVPLLQEYAYEDYSTLADYLGAGLVDAEAQALNEEKLTDPDALLQALEERYGPDVDEG